MEFIEWNNTENWNCYYESNFIYELRFLHSLDFSQSNLLRLLQNFRPLFYFIVECCVSSDFFLINYLFFFWRLLYCGIIQMSGIVCVCVYYCWIHSFIFLLSPFNFSWELYMWNNNFILIFFHVKHLLTKIYAFTSHFRPWNRNISLFFFFQR